MINGFDISKDFFENGECCVEAQIESEIHHAIKQVNPNIKIRKSKLGKGFTDGIIKLYDNNYHGFIINESKRLDDLFPTAFVQAMFYAGTFLYDVSLDKEINFEKFLGFFLTNAYKFIFVPKKYIKKQIIEFKPFWDALHYICPNKAAKDCEVQHWATKQHFKYFEYNLDKTFILDNLIKDIYENNY